LIEGENPEAEKIISKNIPVAVLEEIIVKLIKKMYVREQIKKGVLNIKGNEKMKSFYLEEKFKYACESRKYKQQKRIIDARAEMNAEEGLIDGAKKADDRILAASIEDIETIDPNWVPFKAEEFFRIGSWKELHDLY